MAESKIVNLNKNNKLGTPSVSLTGYSSGNPYITPSDGYIVVGCSNDTVAVYYNGIKILDYGPFTSRENDFALFVRKGASIYITYTGSPVAKFHPLV